MSKRLFLSIAATFLILASAQGQARPAKEQSILKIFGRLNVERDPCDYHIHS